MVGVPGIALVIQVGAGVLFVFAMGSFFLCENMFCYVAGLNYGLLCLCRSFLFLRSSVAWFRVADTVRVVRLLHC